MDLTSASLAEYRKVVEPFLRERDYIHGYCRGCKRVTVFNICATRNSGEWENLLEGMLCSCGLNGRMRLALKVIDDLCYSRVFERPIVFERLTPLFPFIEERFPSLVGCEFLGDEFISGSIHEINAVKVRHESCMSLSFESASIDMAMHFDVIEHVPDAFRAFQEIYRILVKGGIMLFTCPFYHNLERNIIRAIIKDNRIDYLLPPVYHGNPLSDKGSFVFIHPSWEIIDMLYYAGFKSVSLMIEYSLAEGIISNGCPFDDGHMWPVVILAQK
jgi:SAM-dependent methyltransferase